MKRPAGRPRNERIPSCLESNITFYAGNYDDSAGNSM
jgi:hypothetical protein